MPSHLLRCARLLGAVLALGLAGLLTPALSAAATTIDPAPSGSAIYIDSSTSSPTLKGSYIAYTITNTAAESDVWVTADGFSGGVVTLAPNAASRIHVGPMAAGATTTVFFYVQATGATSTAQTHVIHVYNGEPGAGGTELTSATESKTVVETQQANSNKVTSVSVSTSTPGLGGTFAVTVNGTTGTTVGSQRVLYFTPAADVNFPANAFQLISTRIAFNESGCPSAGLNCATVNNTLAISTSSMPDTADTPYVATYTFRAINTIATSTSVSPVGYLTSGGPIKHTSTGNFGALSPISPVSNTLTLGLASSRSLVGATSRTVTYTATATNSGSGAASLDDFVATIPTGATYVTGSATYDGSPIADPSISDQTATWAGVYSVPGNGTRTLTFQVTLPSISGAYTTSLLGHVASAQVDTSLSTSDSSPATATVTVDPVAPSVSFTSTPAADTPSTAATFDYAATKSSTYQCQLDSGAWSACGSTSSGTGSDTVTGLADGLHTFSVIATDDAGNVSTAATYSWTVDTSLPPDAPVVTSPGDGSITSDSEPTITLAADQGTQDTVYVDGTIAGTPTADAAGNATLTLASPLSDGQHTVYAVASNGTTSSGPSATRTFTVDTTPPAAPTVTAPADGGTVTTTPTVTLSAEAGSTDEIDIDGASVGTATADATGQASLTLSTSLSAGPHTVSATATDAAGNTGAGSPVNHFTVALAPAPPTIVTPADGSLITDNQPTVTLTAAAGTTDAVFIDGTGVGTVTADGTGHASLTLASALADGSHTVDATATGPGGTSPHSASHAFTVDTTAPSVAIDTRPDISTTDTTAAFSFSSADQTATFQCRIDGGAWTPCASPATYAGLSVGAHTFSLRALDPPGNISAPRTYGWTVVAPAPAPPAPAPSGMTSTGVGTAPQSQRLSIPAGGSIVLLDATGAAATTVTVSHQGTYVLNTTTGVVSFVPVLGWSGAATPVHYEVTDALGQTGTATYIPTVTRPSAPSATSIVSVAATGATQTETILVPAGGSVTLLDGSTATNRMFIRGQGTYTLNAATESITFAPMAHFVGRAHAVRFRITDAYGQTTVATYMATVTRSTGAAVGPARAQVARLTVVATADDGTVPVGCRLAHGTMNHCAVTLVAHVGARPVLVGAGRASVRSPHRRLVVAVRLTALGRTLAARLGGDAIRVRATIDTAGQQLTASAAGRVVARSFVLPDALLFHTDDASLLPTAKRTLAALRHRLAGARSVTCIGYADSTGGDDRDDADLGPRRAAVACGDLGRGTTVATHATTGAVTVAGDLDREQPVVGVRIRVTY